MPANAVDKQLNIMHAGAWLPARNKRGGSRLRKQREEARSQNAAEGRKIEWIAHDDTSVKREEIERIEEEEEEEEEEEKGGKKAQSERILGGKTGARMMVGNELGRDR
ncbi:hypothetical protein K0M31_004894 [Melipona bicolor]|uniref:Uncharacterized protein n=1 Tax=Melipona bicolor TaxID=60889 RepID=A0AA40KMV9_9HYME|nr:hypothetical protein K0M31_004894 [Melipona bicolor]